MSLRVRGQEAVISISIDNAPQEGNTFVKVRDFRSTPRSEIKEEDYLGETYTDLDFQHHGYDLAFSVDNQDSEAIAFLDTIVARERDHLAHPEISIKVTYAFRNGSQNVQEVYQQVFLRVAEQGFGGRKEYIRTNFEGKAKTKATIVVA